jgi:uncharacterized membrane protein
VPDPHPSAEEAQAAIALANSQAARVRRSDRQFRWILLAIAVMYLAVGAVMSVSPHHGSNPAGLAVVLVMGVVVAAIVVVALRIRAYSRVGILWFTLTASAFTVWNATVTSASLLTHFWAAGQPSYHFGLSVLVGVIPLVVGAWLIGRR